MRRICIAFVLACAAAALPAAASAATLAITTGPDPVESIATQVGVAGTAESTDQVVQLTVKPAGGSGCGANRAADTGEFGLDRRLEAGPYAEAVNWNFRHAGSYLLCAWLIDTAQNGDPVIASTSQTLVVRVPHLALSFAAPPTVLRGRTFQIVTMAQTEAEREVEVAVLKDTGRGCPANWAAASSTSGVTILFGISVTGGPTTRTDNQRIDAPGRYLVCGYVDYGSDITPEATAFAVIDVVRPCIVPRLRRGTSLRRAKARIVAAHCTVGKIAYVHSTTRPRGTIVKLSPKPGSGHATNAPVAIKVSRGPPRPRHHRR